MAMGGLPSMGDLPQGLERRERVQHVVVAAIDPQPARNHPMALVALDQGAGAGLVALGHGHGGDHGIEEAALEIVDALVEPPGDRGFGVAAGQDDPLEAQRTKGVVQFGGDHVVGHVLAPVDLDVVAVVTLGVHELQGDRAHAVQHGLVTARAQVIAGAEEAVQIVEDVHQLEFHHQPGLAANGGLELAEHLGFDGGHVEVDGKRGGRLAEAGILQHRQHPQVQDLRQMLEQPAIGQDVDVGGQDLLQIHDRHVEFLKRHFRRLFFGKTHAGLTTDDAGDIGDADALEHLGQVAGVQGLHRRRVAVLDHTLLRLVQQLGADGEEGIVLAFQVVEGDEAIFAIHLGIGQRVFREQGAQLVDDGVQIGQPGILADQHDVVVGQQEHLAAEHVDHGLEHAEGDADLRFLAVGRQQPRQMQMQRLAPFTDAAHAFGGVVEKVLRRDDFLRFVPERGRVHLFPILAKPPGLIRRRCPCACKRAKFIGVQNTTARRERLERNEQS
uniref:Uncharacterized protein n=1 Tax=Magnetospirillum gryphiswaldense TaxID=55518 RepID=A4U5K5_9PROT|nr:hypothetical protein MGR_4230 [Magnetospirillum gryphiswaldense MSR-1]